MKKLILVLVWLLGSFGILAPSLKSQEGTAAKQPVAPVRPVTDDYYGTKIVDNYRYMENLKDPEVQEWFKNQNDYTSATLANIPGREKLLARIKELDQSVASVSDIQRLPGDLYFYQKLLPGERVGKLYMREGLSGAERLIVDPGRVEVAPVNAGKGGNAIGYVDISQDGKYVAVGITPGGSENDTEVHVFDVATSHETGDVIFRAHGGNPQWLADNRSFVYRRLQDLPPDAPQTELRQKDREYLHVLGTDPQKDHAVFGYGVVPSIDVDPKHGVGFLVSPGSKYAIGLINPGGVSPNSSYYIEPVEAVGTSNSAWRKFADLSDDVTDVAIHGEDLYLLTFRDASRYKVLRTDARHPDLSSAEVVVPPTEAVVQHMSTAQDALYVQVLDGGINRILRVPYGPKPKVENLALPLDGSASPMGSDPRVPGTLLGLASWTRADRYYAYDPNSKQVTDTKLQPAGPFDDPSDLVSVEVKAESYDGTLVPLSIVYKKGMKLDGSNPTLLNGYGAYGLVFSSPGFDPTQIAWYEKGGIFANCGVRGGGEYGEDWHLAGKGPTKPNTWRDFIACAEYLVDKKYTSPAHLAGKGASAGGILIGRAITERPDLFAAAVIVSGVLDALRFETTANGVGNVTEFGSTKTKAGFEALYAMSSYHHVKDRTPYPAVLVTVGMNDPRVDPWESAKMTARLQAATSSGKPVLLYVHYATGHGRTGATRQQLQESMAGQWSLLLWQLGDPAFQPIKK